MTEALPPGLSASFLVAASELGMASASRIFVEETSAARGPEGVSALRDSLGREFPVLDFVASAHLEGQPFAPSEVDEVLAELDEPRRLLIVGLEADAVDRLVPKLPPATRIGLSLGGGGLEPDPARAAATYDGAVEIVPLGEWPRWAGARSALLTFVYGSDGSVAFVSPTYLRLIGPDVRTSFRSLVGWDLLGRAPRLFPRYLAGASTKDFSAIVSTGPRGERP